MHTRYKSITESLEFAHPSIAEWCGRRASHPSSEFSGFGNFDASVSQPSDNTYAAILEYPFHAKGTVKRWNNMDANSPQFS
jgi:hypothetical protein